MEGQFLIVPTQKNIEAFKADLIKTEKTKLLGKTEGIIKGS